MKFFPEELTCLVQDVFAAAGSESSEADRIAHSLVDANLAGHDSHGVMRVPFYIQWLREGKVVANQRPEVVVENDALLLLDGRFGFGQVMGAEAMKAGLAKMGRQGVVVVGLRNSAHLGRIGEWAEMATRAGVCSVHFVNTNGAGVLVAPQGGTQRRISANPIAAGVPRRNGPPVILDMSTCTIAEGKIRVAFHKGARVPTGCILDGHGNPTDNPRLFYADPPGVILPLGGHKGYALGVIVELLTGALLGSLCSQAGVDRVGNTMLTILLDPKVFGSEESFHREAEKLFDWIGSSAKVSPDAEILIPGEPEHRTRHKRQREGIDLDETTWGKIVDTCRLVGLAAAKTDHLGRGR